MEDGFFLQREQIVLTGRGLDETNLGRIEKENNIKRTE